MNLNNSIRFEKECSKVIPAGSSTLAKSPHRLVYGYSPFYAERALGSHFTDIDGNDWLDCEMAMGTVVWGHNRREINESLIRQIEKGIVFSIPSTMEYELAEILLHRFPQFEAAKFFKNGADSVYAAVRSARRTTGRVMTLSCEYHGWLDWCSPAYYDCPPSALGIPDVMKDTFVTCRCNAEEIEKSIRDYEQKLACVVLCPAKYSAEQLKHLISHCHSKGILVVFDEVTSGVRFAYGGATTLYRLNPDFLCLSKGLTNGLPLAVVLGNKNEIMLMEQLQISNAHSGEHLALVAAIACEKLLSQTPEWPTWNNAAGKIIGRLSDYLSSQQNKTLLRIEGSVGCFSLSTLGVKFMEDPFRIYLIKYMAQHHIFTKGYIIFSDAHTQAEMDQVGEALFQCLIDYHQGVVISS